MEFHEYILNVRDDHAKTTKPIMKESQIHKGDDCNGKKLESKFLWNGNCD